MENQILLNSLQSIIAETHVQVEKTEPCKFCYSCCEGEYEFCPHFKEGVQLGWEEDMTQFTEEEFIEMAGMPNRFGNIEFPTTEVKILSQTINCSPIEVSKELFYALENKEKFIFWVIRFTKREE